MLVFIRLLLAKFLFHVVNLYYELNRRQVQTPSRPSRSLGTLSRGFRRGLYMLEEVYCSFLLSSLNNSMWSHLIVHHLS
jgi:hypothetical protein